MPGGALDRLCRQLFALALIVGVLVAALTPLHARATRSWWVIGADGDTVLLDVRDPGSVEPGDVVPLYRFHGGYTRPIGEAVVVGPVDGGLAARVASIRFPLGVQGRVAADLGDRVELVAPGAKVGQRLYAYERGRLVADLAVEEAGPDGVRAMVKRHGRADLAGAAVSEFTVPTRAVPFDAPWLAWLEGGLLALVVAVWGLSWVHPGPGRAWAAFGGALRGALAAIGEVPAARVVFHGLLGFPAVWIGGQVLWFSGTWIVHQAWRWAWAYDLAPKPTFGPFPDGALPLVWAAVAAAYAGFLVRRGTSPLLALWDALAWRPVLPRVRGRSVALWALHLLIAYAFARTLGGFLQGNVRAGLAILEQDLDPQGVFELLRYALWSLTICGCLFGYGHTVLSILWTRPIRELDFSVGGWVTTAACYGPLLGAVVEHVGGGARIGPDPVITGGPLYGAVLGTELLLNALYTASIWNLGRYFGVMTDKGVRTTGFYAAVRHPSYTLESLMFLAIGLPWATTSAQWAVGVTFLVKYWLRSEREDHFMGAADPDYGPYREKVPWKFVPGLY